MTTLSTNISFHGVSRITISEISDLAREGQSWQAVTLYLEDAEGRELQYLQIHAPRGQELKIQFEDAYHGREMDDRKRVADRVDGYDRDDLGLSPDY